MAAAKRSRRRSISQARSDSERILLVATELEEARADIENHEENATERANRLGELLKQALKLITDNATILSEILEAEREKRKLAEDTLPKLNQTAGAADQNFFKRLLNRDFVEVLILIGIGGAIYAASPEFFRLIIGLLSGNSGGGH